MGMLYQKIKKELGSEKGFSLIELIVTLLVFSIFLGAVSPIFFTGQNLYISAQEKENCKLMGDSIFTLMSEKLNFAGEIEILPNNSSQKPKYTNHFALNEGFQLVYNGDEAFHDDFYQNYQLTYKVSDIKDSSLELTVSIVNQKGEEEYYNKSSLKAINLAVTKKEIEAELNSAEYINPIISFSVAQGNKGDLSKDMALNLRNRVLELYENSKSNGRQLPEDWQQYAQSAWASNDNIRTYVLNKYYKGVWGTISQEVIDGSQDLTAFAKGGKLYIMPYLNSNILNVQPPKEQGTQADIECIIYVNTTMNTTWSGVRIMYDHYVNEWKITIEERATFRFVDQFKSAIKEQLSNSSFCKAIS